MTQTAPLAPQGPQHSPRGTVGTATGSWLAGQPVTGSAAIDTTMPRPSFSDPARPRETLPDLYISGDVETDGPIPGRFSMLSFGFAVVGSYDGVAFERAPLGGRTFYTELQPIGTEFEEEALRVNGLNRSQLVAEGRDPHSAMKSAAEWVDEVSVGHRPIFVGYPATFDWMWLYWYFIEFGGYSPFGFSGCIDLKTMIALKTGVPVSNARKSNLPKELRATTPHTHHALDDAIEQGEIFANTFTWVRSA